MKTVRQVRVEYTQDEDTWVAKSPDVPGWIAVGESMDEVRELAREGLPFFLDEEVLIRDRGIPVQTGIAGFVNSTNFKTRQFVNCRGTIPVRFPQVREHA